MTKVYVSFLIVLIGIGFSHCNDTPYSQGQRLYILNCANCHGEQGQGLMSLYPPLAASDYLIQHETELPCLIRNGIKGAIVVNGKPYNGEMTPLKDLTDVQITNILNYIRSAWGNDKKVVKMENVMKALEKCQ